MQAQTCGSAASTAHIGYHRRRPEKSALHRIVREHIETLYAEAERKYPDSGGYPKYVKEAFEGYLLCGQLSEGFARRKCKSCGHERLVAFSCKGRSLCPSCVAKRSAITAAVLVDEVLPLAPYRQWTLSLPFALRYRLIRDAALFSRVLSVFVRTVFSWQRRCARAAGIAGTLHTGSVTLVQRYDSLLKINPHAHSWLPDGVFVEGDDGALTFHRLPPPTDLDVAWLCSRIGARIMRLFDPDAEDEDAEDEIVIAEAQAQATQSPLPLPGYRDDDPQATRSRAPLSAFNAGFSLHAGLDVAAQDRRGLERLLRYGSRPAFSQKRLSQTSDGKVHLKLRKRYYTGQTELVLEPLAFLRRLAAIVAPPNWHLSRYHGIWGRTLKSVPGAIQIWGHSDSAKYLKTDQ